MVLGMCASLAVSTQTFKFGRLPNQKLCRFFSCDVRTRKCQEANLIAWESYYGLMNNTKKVFTDKEINWTMAFAAMNNDGLCIIKGIDSRMFRDLKSRPVAQNELKKLFSRITGRGTPS